MDSLRTLVISDLHFGRHGGGDVLTSGAARERLLRALADCDRLVLLGDVLELRHGPVREALAAAEDALREIGAALRAGGEVVITAGNHDHHLVEGWLARRAAETAPPALGLESDVDWRAGEPLAALAGLLAPAGVRVAYPGVWLRDDVYATHGHYLDLHLTVPTLERLGAGLMRRIVALGPDAPRRAEDYETVLAPMYAWIHAIAQRADPERCGFLHGGSVRGWSALTGPGRRTLRRRAIAAALPATVAGLNRAGMGPLRRELTGPELRRAGLRAMSEAVARLGADSGHVIFGHTHRAGPLPADDGAEWCTVAGTRLVNAGCWVQEPAFLGPDPTASPYRAGFAVLIDGDEPPRLVNLLDGARLPERTVSAVGDWRSATGAAGNSRAATG